MFKLRLLGRETGLSQILKSNRWIITFSFLALVVTLVAPISGQNYKANANAATAPSIQIIRIPPKGGGSDRMEPIAGAIAPIREVNVKECAIVIFAFASGTWYVQPYVDSPYTEIGGDGRWENDTHLGSRYAALLVRRSYEPPATTGVLPTGGGDVLAVVNVPASQNSAASDDGSGFDGAFQFSESVILFILLIVAVCLVAFNEQAKQFVSSACVLLSGLIEGGKELFKWILDGIVDWLKMAHILPSETSSQKGEPQQRGGRPHPVLSFFGILCLGAAVAVAFGEFEILRESVLVIWPWKNTSPILALNMVLMIGMIGLLMHYVKIRLLKVIFVLFILIIGLISFLRTMETMKATRMSVTSISTLDESNLIINDSDARTEDNLANTKEDTQKAAPIDLEIFLYSMLAAGIAILFALAEFFGMYGGVRLADRAIVWLIASPILLIFALPYSACYLLARCKFVETINGCLNALLDAMARACSAIIGFAKQLPGLLQDGYYAWRKNVQRCRFELKCEKLVQDAQQLERKAELGHLKWMNDERRTTVEKTAFGILNGTVENFNESFKDVSSEVSKKVVQDVADFLLVKPKRGFSGD